MIDGKCTKCGAREIQKIPYTNAQRDSQHIAGFSSVKLSEYVCCGCGLLETYLADMSDVDRIKEKCARVETKE